MYHSPILAFAVFALVWQTSLYVTTIYLHRCLTHKALSLSPGVIVFCRIVTWLTTGIRPRQWVAVHRKHHANSDEEGDPHSPLLLGFGMVQFGNVILYKRVLRDGELVRRYAKDLPADRWDKLLLDRAWLGLGLGIVLLVIILGPWLGIVTALVHAVAYLLASAAINAIGHYWGKRPYPNPATNNQWLAFLVAGEGLHNNHHAAPTSAQFALNRNEIDPGWWLIQELQRYGLAKVRHDEPVFAAGMVKKSKIPVAA